MTYDLLYPRPGNRAGAGGGASDKPSSDTSYLNTSTASPSGGITPGQSFGLVYGEFVYHSTAGGTTQAPGVLQYEQFPAAGIVSDTIGVIPTFNTIVFQGTARQVRTIGAGTFLPTPGQGTVTFPGGSTQFDTNFFVVNAPPGTTMNFQFFSPNGQWWFFDPTGGTPAFGANGGGGNPGASGIVVPASGEVMLIYGDAIGSGTPNYTTLVLSLSSGTGFSTLILPDNSLYFVDAELKLTISGATSGSGNLASVLTCDINPPITVPVVRRVSESYDLSGMTGNTVVTLSTSSSFLIPKGQPSPAFIGWSVKADGPTPTTSYRWSQADITIQQLPF